MILKREMSAAELATLIEADPVLASEVLRSANSSFFRGLGDVARVRGAIVRLGGRSIAALAVAASQKRVYSASSPRIKNRLVHLWRHASATAYGCRWLANRLGLREREDEAFLAGLLHDVGKLSILRAIEELAGEEASDGLLPDAVIDAALRQLHSGHGSELLAGWNIPEVFCEVAAHHHDFVACLGVAFQRLFGLAVTHASGQHDDFIEAQLAAINAEGCVAVELVG